MPNQAKIAPCKIEKKSRTWLVKLETNELLTMTWALVQFANHSKGVNRDLDATHIQITENLIIQFQDILDADQIQELCSMDASRPGQ